MTKKIGGHLGPPPTLIIFPKSTDQNSEIFSVVEKPYNYVFGDDLLLPSPRGRGYKLQTFDQCLHIVMVIGKCTGVFRGIFWLGGGVEKRRIYWGNFPSRNLSWGKKISMKGVQDLLALFKKKTIKK